MQAPGARSPRVTSKGRIELASQLTFAHGSKLAEAYVSFGLDVCDRYWRMASGYARRTANAAISAALDPEPEGPSGLLKSFLAGAKNYGVEISSVLPVALDVLSRNLDGRIPPAPDETHNPYGPAPAPRKMHQVLDVPVVLPVRIVDASQGWAVYFVSAAKAQAHLDRITNKKYSVVEIGGRRAALTILGCDYRETDLGKYSEIGIGLFVRPRNDPSELPGTYFLSLSVNQEFNLHRASALWGYRKTLAPNLKVNYSADRLVMAIDRNERTTLSVSFPRFGNGRATDHPIYTYGLSNDGKETPQKTLISRSAAGEGVQIGGDVELRLGRGKQKQQKGCVCSLEFGDNQPCVCELLSDLGVTDSSKPAANGWLEHMSATVSAAMDCK